jgi:hypothetical protein
MTKARAFLIQAQADLAFFAALIDSNDPRVLDCHRLQVLQMSVEKLGKAVLYHAAPDATYGHVIVAKLINVIRTKPIATATGFKSFAAYKRFLDAAKPVLTQIESFTPAVSERKAEYPFRQAADDDTSWRAPCEFPPRELHLLLRSGLGPRVLAFLRLLANRSEDVFDIR